MHGIFSYHFPKTLVFPREIPIHGEAQKKLLNPWSFLENWNPKEVDSWNPWQSSYYFPWKKACIKNTFDLRLLNNWRKNWINMWTKQRYFPPKFGAKINHPAHWTNTQPLGTRCTEAPDSNGAAQNETTVFRRCFHSMIFLGDVYTYISRFPAHFNPPKKYKPWNTSLVGGFIHLKNMSQIGRLPQMWVKMQKYLKPPPRSAFYSHNEVGILTYSTHARATRFHIPVSAEPGPYHKASSAVMYGLAFVSQHLNSLQKYCQVLGTRYLGTNK